MRRVLWWTHSTEMASSACQTHPAESSKPLSNQPRRAPSTAQRPFQHSFRGNPDFRMPLWGCNKCIAALSGLFGWSHHSGSWCPNHCSPNLSLSRYSSPNLTLRCGHPAAVSRYGLHNPLHNPDRYVKYGEIAAKAAAALADPEMSSYFASMIQRVAPKHIDQCHGEVETTRKWLATYSGDGVRNLARSFAVPGDRFGQESRG